MPKAVQPNFVLSVELEELFITAGLQDRVIQVTGGEHTYRDGTSSYTVAASEIRNNHFGRCLQYFWCDVTSFQKLFSYLYMHVQLCSHRGSRGCKGCLLRISLAVTVGE